MPAAVFRAERGMDMRMMDEDRRTKWRLANDKINPIQGSVCSVPILVYYVHTLLLISNASIYTDILYIIVRTSATYSFNFHKAIHPSLARTLFPVLVWSSKEVRDESMHAFCPSRTVLDVAVLELVK